MPEMAKDEIVSLGNILLGRGQARTWSPVAMILALIGAMSLAVAVAAPSAGAEAFGQIGEGWGAPGSGAGQLLNPASFGVNPSDGSVFAVDVTPDLSHYRIQKFSATGEFEASVEIARFTSSEAIVTLHGVAVNPSLKRLYLIEGCKVKLASPTICKPTGNVFVAQRILVYSTEPSAGKLEELASLSLPEGDPLFGPQSISVDPSNGDLVILAENGEGHTVVQRVSSGGTAGARFVDSGNALRPEGGKLKATSIAVGPDGTAYTLTGASNAKGAEFTRAWDFPPNLSGVQEVPDFAMSAEREGWILGLLSPSTGNSLLGGPQIAISPNGDTLYWKESISPSTPTEPGEVLVRGYSLSQHSTNVLYGDGSGRCAITTSAAGVATRGENLVVFDYGPPEGQTEPAYGGKVLTFGPGGGGCPKPAAKFSVNGQEEDGVMVAKGETVTFDASKSELFQGFRRELIWKFGDGSEKVVEFTPATEAEPEEEAELTVTHQYVTAGEYAVRLEIRLSEAPLGSPPPVERTLKVEGPSEPKFKLTVSETGSGTVTSSPGGIDCGLDCEVEFERGTVVTLIPSAAPGSEFKGWNGTCTGASACEVTISEAKSVGAQFAPALKPKFKLTVAETGSGTVTSSPSGIVCGPSCEAEFEEGTSIMLVAAPAEDSEFKGWGGACSGVGNCEVTLGQARTVSAEFVPAPKLRVVLTVLRTGPGIVTSAPSGIACGAICERGYEKGNLVRLTPIPASASKFEGWGGACAGTGACEVTMSVAREVTATFGTVFSVPPIASLTQSAGSPPAVGGVPASNPSPSPRPKKKTSSLARCKKLKGRKKAKCTKHVRKGRR